MGALERQNVVYSKNIEQLQTAVEKTIPDKINKTKDKILEKVSSLVKSLETDRSQSHTDALQQEQSVRSIEIDTIRNDFNSRSEVYETLI